jgi:hypothetical protein
VALTSHFFYTIKGLSKLKLISYINVYKKIKVMIKKEKKELVDLLNQTLQDTNKMFENQTQSYGYIIGYLEGTIKTIISELED